MRIAWFTPFAPKSAIGHYSEAILAELTRDDDVTAFVPGGSGHGPTRPTDVPVVVIPDRPAAEFFASLDAFDLAVYNLGNYAPYHQAIYDVAAHKPGVVVLHDLVLRDFFVGYFHHVNEPGGFARHLNYAHGPDAGSKGRAAANGRPPAATDEPPHLAEPMFAPAVRGALGVLTHSEYARGRVAATVPVLVRAIDFPLFGPCLDYATIPPRQRQPGGDRVRLLTFGMLNPNKLIHATIRAIGETPALRRGVAFEVIGSGCASYERQLRDLVRAYDLDDVVVLSGWQSDAQLTVALSDAEVVINLRNPHYGESSASLLDSLLAGAATVVWDHGYYGEFPDDVVVKVRSEAELPAAIERLVGDPGLRRRYGEAARTHALERFDTARYCRQFRAFAAEVLRQKPAFALADTASQLLVEFGAGALDGLSARFAEVIAGLVPPAPIDPPSTTGPVVTPRVTEAGVLV